MKKTLLATTALAFAGAMAAGAASAQEQLSASLSGYMEQWVGMANSMDGSGFSQQSDSEFYVNGSLEADNGLTFGVTIQVEGNGDGNIDESRMTIGGSFGRIQLGADNDVLATMHVGGMDVGIGLNHGDVGNWISDIDVGGTAGWPSDDRKISYYSPRISGVQFGVTYTPETGTEASTSAPMDNDDNAWSVALNVEQAVGDASVSFSVGHYVKSSSEMTEHTIMPFMELSDGGLTVAQYLAHTGNWDAWENMAEMPRKQGELAQLRRVSHQLGTLGEVIGGEINNLDLLRVHARRAQDALMAARETVMTATDDETVTNAGLTVGFGAFSFNVAYAMYDQPRSYDVDFLRRIRIDDGDTYDSDGDGMPHMWDHDDDSTSDEIRESRDNNDPSNDILWSRIVEEPSADSDVVNVGAMYSNGPMDASLSYIVRDRASGMNAEAVMASFRYTLAPGVASRTSIFQAEDDSTGADGTGFVTGIKINF